MNSNHDKPLYWPILCHCTTFCQLEGEIFRTLGIRSDQKKCPTTRMGFELLVANCFSAYLTLFIKCTGCIYCSTWTGNGWRDTTNLVRDCRRPCRGSDLEHPKYKTGMPTTQPRRAIHIITSSSSSSVIRCVAQPVQWLKQGLIPSPQIMSRSNAVHSASYLVGNGTQKAAGAWKWSFIPPGFG
jgi:hypothetical protein